MSTPSSSATPVPDPVVDSDEREWMPGDAARLTFDLVVIALGVCYLIVALTALPVGTLGRPGAAFFPLVAGALCVGFLVIDAARLAVRAGKGSWARGSGHPARAVWVILGSVAFYVVIADVIGHLLAAALIAGALLRVLGTRKWWHVILIAVAFALATDLLFGLLLGVRLPDGLLGIGVSAWI